MVHKRPAHVLEVSDSDDSSGSDFEVDYISDGTTFEGYPARDPEMISSYDDVSTYVVNYVLFFFII